jgi:hypothetical protein
MTTQDTQIKLERCPCNDNCCDAPDTWTPPHSCEHSDDPESWRCDENWRTECRSCEASCYCEV